MIEPSWAEIVLYAVWAVVCLIGFLKLMPYVAVDTAAKQDWHVEKSREFSYTPSYKREERDGYDWIGELR